VFVFEHTATGSKGLILDKQTPFYITEMAPTTDAAFASNTLFVGGEVCLLACQ
jgi:putative AlgH/UPF0301 family transcriptional regulator